MKMKLAAGVSASLLGLAVATHDAPGFLQPRQYVCSASTTVEYSLGVTMSGSPFTISSYFPSNTELSLAPGYTFTVTDAPRVIKTTVTLYTTITGTTIRTYTNYGPGNGRPTSNAAHNVDSSLAPNRPTLVQSAGISSSTVVQSATVTPLATRSSVIPSPSSASGYVDITETFGWPGTTTTIITIGSGGLGPNTTIYGIPVSTNTFTGPYSTYTVPYSGSLSLLSRLCLLPATLYQGCGGRNSDHNSTCYFSSKDLLDVKL